MIVNWSNNHSDRETWGAKAKDSLYYKRVIKIVGKTVLDRLHLFYMQ